MACGWKFALGLLAEMAGRPVQRDAMNQTLWYSHSAGLRVAALFKPGCCDGGDLQQGRLQRGRGEHCRRRVRDKLLC